MLEKSSAPLPAIECMAYRLRAKPPSGVLAFDCCSVLLRQAQVLEHQVRAKATRIALAGGCGFPSRRGKGCYFSSAQLPPELRRMISPAPWGPGRWLRPGQWLRWCPPSRCPAACCCRSWPFGLRPRLPAWKMLAPIFSSTGRARSRSAASPPTMKVRVPAMAPPVPPEHGRVDKGHALGLRRPRPPSGRWRRRWWSSR